VLEARPRRRVKTFVSSEFKRQRCSSAGISAETALILSWTKFSGKKQGEGGSQIGEG
jgi:hypothetical protein